MRSVPVGSAFRACLWLVLVIPSVASTAPTTLTLAEAIRVALARAPLIEARQAGITAAQEDAARAGALPDLMLTVGIDNLPVTGTKAFDPNADFMTMKKIGLRQEVPSLAKRRARRSLAGREVDQARAQAQATGLAVRRATADAWIDLWAAGHELAALEALRVQADLAVQLAKARVSGGGGSVSDALATQAVALELDNRIEAARANQAAAQAGLARWVGHTASDARSEAPAFDVLPHSQAQLLAAIDRVGPLLASAAEVETAASAIDVARAERHPDWTVGAAYGQRSGGRSDMLMLEVGIGLPLFTRNRQDRGIAAREDDYQAAVATREDLRRQEVAQIGADVARWEGLKRQVALHEDARLPLAHDRSTTALAAYRAGGPLQPWLDARRDELEVRLAHATHLGELGHVWAALALPAAGGRVMTRSHRTFVAVIVLIALLGGVGMGYWWARSGPAPPATPAVASSEGGQVLYWYDPMQPEQHFDKPGKSPFMDMMLVPKYADDGVSGGIRISPALRQSLGVRTVVASPGLLEAGLRVPGTIAWDLREERVVSARVDAVVDRLYVGAPFERVRAGQPLAILVAQEWSTAIAEARAVGQGESASTRALGTAATARLRALGVPPGSRALDGGRIQLTSPINGIVSEIGVREGESAPQGSLLFRLNGTDRVWLEAAIPQARAAGVGVGTPAIAAVDAFPGATFHGEVEALIPEVDSDSRTQLARIVLANSAGQLASGMFAQVTLQPAATKAYPLVPTDALIGDGTQARVIVQDADGNFRPVTVLPGRSGGGMTQILSGLAGGEHVVASGQFLIDSEASLSGALERLNAGAADHAHPPGNAP